jgi:hypothetical protein
MAPPAIPGMRPAPKMSVWARMLNMFATPGEVFEDVKVSRFSVWTCLAPTFLFAITAALLVFTMFSQPNIQQRIREQQDKAIEERVKSGKMTQQQADQALAAMDKFMGPSMMKLFGSVSAVAGAFVQWIAWAFLLWLLAKLFLKSPVDFSKTMEVSALVLMVLVLGALVTLLLTASMGRMGATPSLALLVNDFEATNKTHLALGAINIFSFWEIALLALGLAKLTGASWAKAGLVVGGFWVVKQALFLAIGWGQMAQ